MGKKKQEKKKKHEDERDEIPYYRELKKSYKKCKAAYKALAKCEAREERLCTESELRKNREEIERLQAKLNDAVDEFDSIILMQRKHFDEMLELE